MLRANGHDVSFYGIAGSRVDCNEFIPVSDQGVLDECYGSYDRSTNFHRYHQGDSAHRHFNKNAIAAIKERMQPQDILLCPLGLFQKELSDATGLLTVEPGIGYSGTFAQNRIFESYAWMHYLYGQEQRENGWWYDAVIPNCYEPADFPFVGEKQDYLLYMGRIVNRKGVSLASEVAKATGHTLYVVGQGSLDNPDEGLHLAKEGHIVYKPAVGPEERAELLGNAKAVLMPTYYIEPFGSVALEAQLCGTPVITTDWGAFPETVVHGVTGYRCRVFEEFCRAVENIGSIDPEACHRWVANNYSLERCGAMYEEYFQRLHKLFGNGWYSRS